MTGPRERDLADSARAFLPELVLCSAIVLLLLLRLVKALDRWQDGEWKEFAVGTSIGNRKLLRTERITSEKIRLRITKAAASPAISEFGVFAEP